MPTFTRSARGGEFLLSESPGTFSREAGTLLSGQKLDAGTVLAFDGDGKLLAWASGAAAGILLEAVDATHGDRACDYVARDAEVKLPLLTFPGADDDAIDALGQIRILCSDLSMPRRHVVVTGSDGTVPNGGTGVTTLASHGVVIGQGASPVHVTGAGTIGQVLTSNGAAADPTFQDAGGGGGAVSQVRVVLSSAQLLALFTSPVEIVPAPGTGKYIRVIVDSYTLNFGSVPYTGDATTGLYYGTGSGHAVDQNIDTPFLGGANNVKCGIPTNIDADPSVVSNLAVVLTSTTSNLISGDGTGSVTVVYVIVTL